MKPPATLPRVVGYVRTSTVDQRLDLQLDALRAIGADPIHQDQISGARTTRPGLDECMGDLQPGDTLAVWKLDRLGRSLHHLISMVAMLQARGVHFRSLTEGIDSGTPHGRLLLGLFGTLAEFERDLIRERIAAGRVAAQARGQRFGPRPKLPPAKVADARLLLEAGRKPVAVARTMGCSRSTLYAAMAREDKQHAMRESGLYAKRGRGRPRKTTPTEGEKIA